MPRNLEDKTRAARTRSRREMLLLAGTTAASLAAGCLRGQPAFAAPTPAQAPLGTAAVTPLACIVRPRQTGGPYFVDEKLKRTDIRSGKAGVPLHLVLRVARLRGGSCTPLTGATVDVWQCDALGVYSDFLDINGLFDTRPIPKEHYLHH